MVSSHIHFQHTRNLAAFGLTNSILRNHVTYDNVEMQ